MPTVTPDEALARILAEVEPMPVVDRDLLSALDHVLAEDINSSMSVPPFDNSAMDGYAVRSGDVVDGVQLRVIGDMRAGRLAEESVGAGTAIRIMTGAPIPPGADAVVAYEKTRALGADLNEVGPLTSALPDSIQIDVPVRAGLNIRRAGEDLTEGSLLIRGGQLLGPSEIAVLATIGRSRVRVNGRPTIGVLSTGDELVEPGQDLPPGHIFNSNGYAIGALVTRAGADLISGPAVGDSLHDLQEHLDFLVKHADLIVTSGGASGGASDIVAQLAGSERMIESLSVKMRPGKPLALGWLNSSPQEGTGGRAAPIPFIGLPGNPVAAMVAFELFARPAILKMRGLVDLEPIRVAAAACEDLANASDRLSFVRVRVTSSNGAYSASSVGLQSSAAVSSLLQANGLAEVPGDGVGVARGEPVMVRLTDWSGSPRDGLLRDSPMQRT